MEGIGGVIGDSSKKYGPMNSLDSIGAVVYAMLIGCHELHKLGGYKAIFEADSFFDIQWRCGKSSYPWQLADLGARYFFLYRSLFFSYLV